MAENVPAAPTVMAAGSTGEDTRQGVVVGGGGGGEFGRAGVTVVLALIGDPGEGD